LQDLDALIVDFLPLVLGQDLALCAHIHFSLCPDSQLQLWCQHTARAQPAGRAIPSEGTLKGLVAARAD
jgi:hypothetical protein